MPPSAPVRSLDAFFAPSSISVVGVSRRSQAFSRRALGYLQSFAFPGRLSAVNPALDEIEGVACYPTLTAVPDPVDLALIFTAADRVGEVVDDAVRAGVRAAIIYSSGFAETGGDGAARQEAVAAAARQAGLRLLGPNCQGVIHLAHRTVATFTAAAAGLADAVVGPVAYVGQSGAVGGALCDLMRIRGIAPTAWVSTGNQIDVTVTEAAGHFVDDTNIETILVYLEQTPNGRQWTEVCTRAAAGGKQIICLQTGRSAAGRRAAASHTGALVGENRAFELLCRQHDVLLARDLREMIDLALGRRGGFHRGGRRFGVVTTSGGAGGLAADGAEERGMALAELSPRTRARLDAMLPGFASSANPVDVTAQFTTDSLERTGELCGIVAEDPQVEHLLLVMTNTAPDSAVAVAERLVEVQPELRVPCSVVFLTAPERIAPARRRLAESGIPVFDMVSDVLDTVATLTGQASGHGAGDGDVPASDAGRSPAPTATTAADTTVFVITEAEAGGLLDRAGVPRPRGGLVTSSAAAMAVASDRGARYVLKVQSDEILHKTELGAIRLDVGAGEVGNVFKQLVGHMAGHHPNVKVDGVLVQEMVPAGVELLVGVQAGRDGYDPIVSVAMGGTHVELYADVTSRLGVPDENEALAMLRELRGWPLLDGWRGAPRLDVTAAARAVTGIARAATMLAGALIDLEVNPLIVAEHGAVAADFVARCSAPFLPESGASDTGI